THGDMRTTNTVQIRLLLAGASTAAAQQTPPPQPAVPDTAAAADSAAAAAMLAGQPASTAPSEAAAQSGGGPTNPRLMPDISVVGDLVGDLSPKGSTQADGTRFGVREVELAVQAAVDPYFRGDVFLGFSDAEGVGIEQAYLTTTSLPYGLEARVGRYLMPFGKQNLTHRHDLHTTEYPWVIQRFLGDEGLKGTGLWVSKVLAPFGFYQEIQVTAVDRLGERPEGLVAAEPANKRLSGLGYSARLRNYFDVSQASNFEISASVLTGRVERVANLDPLSGLNAVDARTTTLGADVTYRWRPLQQGLYRSLILQGEFMRQMNQDVADLAHGARDYDGAYLFGRYQVAARTFVGARYDWLQDPLNDGRTLNAGSGYLEFYPSEFSKLSAALERYSPSGLDGVNRLLLQATFAIGPHKPHPF
ncbi:MAG TPA: hypothetical protein VFH27_15950, partial [Longimicrobiaceae bacterium]|nr:hypothetical protein [Longimicrobiaceae bacterium]